MNLNRAASASFISVGLSLILCQSGLALALALEPPETTEPVPTTHSAVVPSSSSARQGSPEIILKMRDGHASRALTVRPKAGSPSSGSSRKPRPKKPRGAWGEPDPYESPGSTFAPADHPHVSGIGIQEGLWWIGPRLHRILGESETGHSTWSDLGDTYKPRSPP